MNFLGLRGVQDEYLEIADLQKHMHTAVCSLKAVHAVLLNEENNHAKIVSVRLNKEPDFHAD